MPATWKVFYSLTKDGIWDLKKVEVLQQVLTGSLVLLYIDETGEYRDMWGLDCITIAEMKGR